MSISVVQYQTSPQKLNVLQQSQNGNSREVIILRKPQPKEILITNPARKKNRNGEKMTNPPPVAVARRNARERNRVKQVNNGFATLRQHIPNSIAAAFESNNGRGGNKKLSKVETLRMAVEYIRSLEDMLAGDEGESNENVSTGSIATSYISSTPSSPALTATANMSYTYPITSQSEDDELSTSPHMRNYQIFYEDNENLEPLSDDLLITSDLELGNQDLSLLNSMHTTGSLSPEMYSDDSLSPRQVYIYPPEPKLRLTPEIKSEPPVLSLPADTDLPVDSKENMIEVMAWWEQQQSRS